MSSTTDLGDKAINHGVNGALGLVRGMLPSVVNQIPGIDEAQEKLRQMAVQQAQSAAKNNPAISQATSGIGAWLSDMWNGILDFIIGMFDASSVPARNGMLAQVGMDSRGNQTAVNPFSSLDKSLGIAVSSQIKEISENHIRDMVGWFGMGKDSQKAINATIATHNEIKEVVYSALRDKYGSKPEDEAKLEAIAQQAASSVTGIDAKALAAKDPSHWLTQNPPATGLGALLYTTQKNSTVAEYKLNTASLSQAVADLAPYKTQLEQKINQTTLAAADQAAQAAKPNIGPATDVPSSETPTPTPVPTRTAPPKERVG